MTDLTLGERHLRPLEGLGDVAESKSIHVRAGNVTGDIGRQHMLVCLINLLARLHGVVRDIRLSVEGNISVIRPNAAGVAHAIDALESLATWANGGRIPVLRGAGGSDIVIDVSGEGVGGADIYGWGAGWRAWIGSQPQRFERDPGRTKCIGPYLAACLVAGEVFKRAKGLKKGRFAEDDAYSLWDGSTGRWPDLVDGPDMAGIRLPPLYLIGAGAVGQGFIQILGASDLVDGYVVSVDHDHHDKEGTNLNRCFLAGIADIGHLKTDAVTRYRALSGLGGMEHAGTLRDYVTASHPRLDPRLAKSEANDEYDTVISAVDIDTSRQDIQGLHPRVVVGGSTDSLRAQAVVYGLTEGAECLGCWNVPDDILARAVEREKDLRAMSEMERRQALTGKVENIEAAMAFLASESPNCGQLGERDVKDFIGHIPSEFSVSFVSMTAAILTAASLFRQVSAKTFAHPPKTVFQFKNLSMDKSTMSRRDGCPHCNPKRPSP
ncbi:ThiF family adenylyltransferase [Devosia submarina]|uniref:ThiF family adenylyltransferase n=1 Tax=Devosia submarina TaxID=1173082 RepID=UPI000D3C6A55|nr:ThiF family adenylyltransferase [Devosia submarina]